MNQRIQALRDEAWRTAKSLAGVAVAIGGGLLPFLLYVFGWVESGSLFWLVIAAMLGTFGVLLIWNLSRYAEVGYWFDRKYRLLSVTWNYTPNDDFETLKAVQVGKRRLVCLSGTIPHISVGVAPAENLTPFDPGDDIEVTLLSYSRDEGTVSVRQPHRQAGSNFSFRVDFNPALREGEEVEFEYTFTLPRFRISSLESLRARCQKGKLDARDYEYSSWSVDFPIDRLVFDQRFSPECGIKPLDVEVERGTASPFEEERRRLLKSRSFRCEQFDGGWRMILDRQTPPMKARYRVRWRPPTQSELSALLADSPEH